MEIKQALMSNEKDQQETPGGWAGGLSPTLMQSWDSLQVA